MSQIKNVTGTAFVVAEFRARENTKPRPLYVDRVVPIFLDERTKQAADAIIAGFPPGGTMVPLRTRYFDDRLDDQIARGCRQVVILGAGLDTRAQRKSAPGVTYFEIDDAATLGFKKTRLAERGFDAPVTFIPGNYVASGVVPLLEGNGFDCDLPSFFIWEGNTMYLTEDAALAVVNELRRRLRRFSISFDYMDEAVIARTTGEAGTTLFVERFAAMGAPWLFGIDDIEAFAAEVDMDVADTTTVGDMRRRFWPDQPQGSIIYDHYALCTLTSKAAARS
jgi:methyltransferase (TIGR00027 family)